MKAIKYSILVIALIIFGFSLFNASWIADEPDGEIILVGHGKWPLPTDTNDCIIDAEIALGDTAYNADVRSLRTVGAYDADAIKFDTDLIDGKLFVPRPPKTNCAADLERPRSTINDAISAMSALQIFTAIKAGESEKADALITALSGQNYPNQIYVYGDDKLTQKVSAALPSVKSLPVKLARQCTIDYKKSGWYGDIPKSCDQGNAIILIDDGFTLWGWPDRLMARFAKNNIDIFIAKDISDYEIIGLDDVTRYSDIPDSFVGTIWIEDIKNLGPALTR